MRPKNAVPEAQPDKATVEHELVPLVDLDVPAVLAERLGVLGGLFVEADVVDLNFPITVEDGRMRVPRDVGIGMMAAVDGGPFTRFDAGGKPHDGAAGKAKARAHGHRAVRDSAVEVHGGEQQGELGGEQAREHGEQDFRHGPTIPYFPGGSRVPGAWAARLSAELGDGVPCSGGHLVRLRARLLRLRARLLRLAPGSSGSLFGSSAGLAVGPSRWSYRPVSRARRASLASVLAGVVVMLPVASAPASTAPARNAPDPAGISPTRCWRRRYFRRHASRSRCSP